MHTLYTVHNTAILDTTTGSSAAFLDADTAELAAADLTAGILDPADLAWDAPAPVDALLTVPDVQDRLAVSRATVYRLLDDGTLGSVSLGPARRVRESELNRYIASLPSA